MVIQLIWIYRSLRICLIYAFSRRVYIANNANTNPTADYTILIGLTFIEVSIG